jgi:hypothetical protein
MDDYSTSRRSWRQSVAQGERSGTKWSAAQPWVARMFIEPARFSGRQMLTPAKAGLIIE